MGAWELPEMAVGDIQSSLGEEFLFVPLSMRIFWTFLGVFSKVSSKCVLD